MNLRRVVPLLVSSAVLFAAGCGGGSDPMCVAEVEATSGDEAPVPPEPVATTPIPVPTTPIPRRQLSATLQDVWTRTEQAIEIRPPNPPEEASDEAIRAWAEGPFKTWLEARLAATNDAQRKMNELHAAPAHERGVGAALFGYLYEDMASGVRGAPVPEEITADPELLGAYIGALDEAVLPAARLAAQAYALCARTLEPLADWSEWHGYCQERGLEVIEIFGVPTEPEAAPAASEAPAAAPAPAE